MLCESEFNSVTFSNMMIYCSKTYVCVEKRHALVAWPGFCVRSRYYIRRTLISAAVVLMVCTWTEEIPCLKVSTTTEDKNHSQLLEENPQVCVGLAFPGS